MPENKNVLSLETPLGGDALRLRSFRGEEGMSRLFEFELEMVSMEESIAAKDLVGQAVSFVIGADSSRPRSFHGYVRRFSAGEILDSGMRRYRAIVVPWLWFLTKETDCRIFQNQTIPEIIETVLSEHPNHDFEFKPTGTYPTLDYCVQYRETTFRFLSRLLEEAGIFYFFRFDEGSHTLVLADSSAAYSDLPEKTIRFTPGDLTEAHIRTWDHDYSFPSGKYTVRDFDFESPTLDLTSDVDTMLDVSGARDFEIYDYPGRYVTAAEGDANVRARMEAEEAQYEVVRATSTCSYLAAGGSFSLDSLDHPADGGVEFLVTAVRHLASEPVGGSGDPYHNEFRCVPSTYVVRPARRTPPGRVRGPQTAVVVGPEGEEIYTDEHGRIKVQFHWDRVGQSDAKSSCWIRVAQSLAGSGWGGMQIPRIGHEVVVEFLEGDPDRPLVTGCVFNGRQQVPYELPKNKTRSLLKTHSSPQGGSQNYNEIRFEDKIDQEELHIQAEKDMTTLVKNDESVEVGHDRHILVMNDHDRKVEEGNERITVERGSREVQINENHTRTVATGDEKIEVTSGSRSVTVGDSRTTDVGKDDTLTVSTGDRTVTVEMGDNSLEIQMGNHATTLSLGKSKTEAMQSIELKVGSSSIKVDQMGVEIKGMMIKIEGTMMTDIKGMITKVDGSAMGKVSGGVLMIN